MRLRSAITALAVCTTSATLLAGCSPDPVAAAPVPTSTSTRPAPSATPTVQAMPTPTMPAPMPSPTPPAEMSRDDEAGAVAAATYFLTELYPYTITSKDTTAWAAMSDPDCIFCTSAQETVASLREAGQTLAVAPIRATNATHEVLNPLAFGVFLEIETGPDAMYGPDGSLIESGPVVAGTASIAVLRRGDVWIVRGVDLVRAEAS